MRQRHGVQEALQKITGIDSVCLESPDNIYTASVATRMSWVSKRVTTRPEDMAYCMLGILGISLSPIYGEGERAFFRLQEEVIKVSNDRTIFGWTAVSRHVPRGYNSILAPHPSAFNTPLYPKLSDQGIPRFALTNAGLLLDSEYMYTADGGFSTPNEDQGVLMVMDPIDMPNRFTWPGLRLAVPIWKLKPRGIWCRNSTTRYTLHVANRDDLFIKDGSSLPTSEFCIRSSDTSPFLTPDEKETLDLLHDQNLREVLREDPDSKDHYLCPAFDVESKLAADPIVIQPIRVNGSGVTRYSATGLPRLVYDSRRGYICLEDSRRSLDLQTSIGFAMLAPFQVATGVNSDEYALLALFVFAKRQKNGAVKWYAEAGDWDATDWDFRVSELDKIRRLMRQSKMPRLWSKASCDGRDGSNIICNGHKCTVISHCPDLPSGDVVSSLSVFWNLTGRRNTKQLQSHAKSAVFFPRLAEYAADPVRKKQSGSRILELEEGFKKPPSGELQRRLRTIGEERSRLRTTH
jgi:hypothetical protein